MKKILLSFFLVFPAFSIASDLYDPETGVLYMSNVTIASGNYKVELQHQGDLVFNVKSAKPVTSLRGTSWSLDIEKYHILTFFEDDKYILSHTNNQETNITAAMEYGTYTWNSQSGEFVITSIIVESDGEGGFSEVGEGRVVNRVEIIGDKLISHESDGDWIFSRIK